MSAFLVCHRLLVTIVEKYFSPKTSNEIKQVVPWTGSMCSILPFKIEGAIVPMGIVFTLCLGNQTMSPTATEGALFTRQLVERLASFGILSSLNFLPEVDCEVQNLLIRVNKCVTAV